MPTDVRFSYGDVAEFEFVIMQITAGECIGISETLCPWGFDFDVVGPGLLRRIQTGLTNTLQGFRACPE